MQKKELPEGEKIWVRYTTSDGSLYYITSKKSSREYYFLYKDDDGGIIRINKSKSPLELEKYIN